MEMVEAEADVMSSRLPSGAGAPEEELPPHEQRKSDAATRAEKIQMNLCMAMSVIVFRYENSDKYSLRQTPPNRKTV
jgi:hypothetical protein